MLQVGLWLLALGASPLPRAVVLVLDGLRPDQVTAEGMPRLWSLKERGVWFSDSHTVYPPMTLVAAAALAAGAFPGKTGILGNTMLVGSEPLYLERFSNLRRAEAFFRSRGERLILADTLYEALRRCGRASLLVGKGGPVALMGRASGAPFWAGGEASPEVARLRKDEGAWTRVERWFAAGPTAGAMLEETFARLVPALHPDLLLFWDPEPDATEHRYGPCSPQADAARREADGVVGAVALWADRAGASLIVVSDHGMSTVLGGVDAQNALPGGRTVPNGGSEYVLPDAPTGAAALAARLEGFDWAGPVLGRTEGIIPLSAVLLDGPRTPPLAFSYAWTSTGGVWSSDFRLHGRSLFPPGSGMHGSFSPLELHDVLLIDPAGGGSGRVVEAPAGIVDVAPTVASLLGCAPPRDADGRDLLASRLPAPPRKVVYQEGKGAARRWIEVLSYGRARYVHDARPGSKL